MSGARERSRGRARRRRPSAFTVLQLAATAEVLRRLAPGATRLPPLVPAPDRAIGATVSVVVPARDEAGRIGPLLAALATDEQVTEVIVVDDESTDGTADVARRAGATVVDGRALPPGWVGKPWALQQGLDAAVGDWVVTLDADTVPSAGFVGALVASVDEHGWDVLTVGPRFALGGVGEQLLHPSMLATLVYRFGPVGPRTPPPPARTMANGQCLVAHRRRLVDLGGFAPAAGHMTDDIALVRSLAAAGAKVGFLDGAALVTVDMHDSVGEVWTQWGRSLPMADVTSPARQAVDLALVWLVMALPLPRLVLRRGTRLDVGLVALRLALTAALAGAYRRPAPGLWLSPLADVPAAARLTWAAVRPVRRWRGRDYGPASASRR